MAAQALFGRLSGRMALLLDKKPELALLKRRGHRHRHASRDRHAPSTATLRHERPGPHNIHREQQHNTVGGVVANFFKQDACLHNSGGTCSTDSAVCGASPPTVAMFAHAVACPGCCAASLRLQLKLNSVTGWYGVLKNSSKRVLYAF